MAGKFRWAGSILIGARCLAAASAALLVAAGSGAVAQDRPPGPPPAGSASSADPRATPEAMRAIHATFAQMERPAPPTPAQMRLPGMTRASIAALPRFTGSLWVPEGVPSDERAYLATMPMPDVRADYAGDARAAIDAIRAGESTAPSTSCTFDGQPRLAWYPYPIQFLFAPGNVMIQEHWIIRPAPVRGIVHRAALDDPMKIQELDLNGDAAAAWQGDTLVIDVTAAREDADTFYGVPNDPKLHVTERYRLLSDDRLERRTVVDAPTYFARPWETVVTYRRAPEASWTTHFCLPDNSVVATEKKAPGAPATPLAIPVAKRAGTRSPAPAGARFTPNLTWAAIEQLPKIDGVPWQSTLSWDLTVVNITTIALVPPLQPEWQARYDAFVARAKAGKAEFKGGACYPSGVPRAAYYSYPPQFIYKPGNSILMTAWGETREIWMDGRGHPAQFDYTDPAIAYLGHSVGWWEGDTLVIDTVGFAPKHELFYDVPNGGAMHVVERYRRLDDARLSLELTVADPQRLAKPWRVSRIYGHDVLDEPPAREAANSIKPGLCRPSDSRESLDAQGNSTLDLTPPRRGLGLKREN